MVEPNQEITSMLTGADINEFSENHINNSTHKYRSVVGDVFDTIKFITECTKPTIALVNGAAVGGGNEFQMACDMAIASEEHAYFMQVGPKVGSVPAGGATQWLPILIGERRAREMIYLYVDGVLAGSSSLGSDYGLLDLAAPVVARHGNQDLYFK